MRRFSALFMKNNPIANPGEGANPGLQRRHTLEPADHEHRKAPSAALPSCAAERVKIGFVGMSAGAGATTLTFAGAEYIASRFEKQKNRRIVTILELDIRSCAPAGWPYDKIGIERRFAGRDFISLYRLAAEGKPLQNVHNMDSGIGFALRVPGESGVPPSPLTLHRLLNNAFGDVILCDIPAQGFLNGADTAGREALIALLSDLDRVICVFDPLPSRLLVSVPAAEVCRAAAAAGIPVAYVFNKLNDGVNLREVARFTGIRDFVPVPALRAETVYRAEYACRSLASEPEIGSALARLFEK